jgi:hypothetical protein
LRGRIQNSEFRSSGVQEFRSSGVQEFRSSGVQEFRSSGVQEFRSIYVGKNSLESQEIVRIVESEISPPEILQLQNSWNS